MTFTPSSTSSFTAGAVFWSMVRAGLGKLNELASFIGLKRYKPRESALRWINSHKVITLTATEVVNYSVHGITRSLTA